MTERTVARQYAHALFDVATREHQVEAVTRDLAGVAALVASHQELKAIFETPLVPPRKKHALVEALVAAGSPIRPEVSRLLLMLADRDRLRILGDLARAYAARVMEAGQAVSADVVTAVPLSQERQTQLAEALGKVTGRTVTVNARVDPAILGGVVARVGSQVFDGSVVRQIERLRERLLADA
ncbi:MAG: ATP synthase F1 subunit delta [Acidobacteriota bacterium]